MGLPTQYGHIGCQEALHSLRTILMTRRHHGLPTYALFIDLIKSFDSINHEALYLTLQRMGIPEKMIQIIKKMYTDCTIQLTVGKEKRTVAYETGVQQGDNMAAILFLFIMQAVVETYQPIKPTQNNNNTTTPNDQKIEFRFFEINESGKQQHGRLLGQSTKSKGKTLEVSNTLYMDDCGFLFTSLEALILNAQGLYDHFAIFGLEIHTGNNEDIANKKKKTKSKTEAVFFPEEIKKKSSKPSTRHTNK
jgi:hypothetical protein